MPKIRFCTLFSGSSANSTFIEINGRAILIDAGAGIKKTNKALNEVGSDLSKIEAIFVTHEHSDHVGGLSTILKYKKFPIISNKKTLNGLFKIPNVDDNLFRVLPTGSKAVKGDFEVTSFNSSHDSAECVGYTVKCGDIKLGVLTDVGRIDSDMLKNLYGCKALVIESNHDTEMLHKGPYPYYLKQRIAGVNGHLSNAECGETLVKLAENGTEKVFLAHLSEENNTPDTAMKTVVTVLEKNNIINGRDIEVQIAPRNCCSKIFNF